MLFIVFSVGTSGVKLLGWWLVALSIRQEDSPIHSHNSIMFFFLPNSAVVLSLVLGLAQGHGNHQHHHHHHPHDHEEAHNHDKTIVGANEQQSHRDLRTTFSCATRQKKPHQEVDFQNLITKRYPGQGSLEQRRLRKKSSSADFSATIPIYHWLYTDNAATQYVTDAQIQAQMDWLNAAFAETGFEFETEAINRIVDSDVFFAYDGLDGPMSINILDEEFKNRREGCMNVLNIFWIDMQDNGFLDLGFALGPGFDADVNLDYAGIHYEAVTGGGYTRYDEGDILVHEVGHWLGLLHL